MIPSRRAFCYALMASTIPGVQVKRTPLLSAIDDAILAAKKAKDDNAVAVLFVLRGALMRGHCEALALHCAEFAQKDMEKEQ